MAIRNIIRETADYEVFYKISQESMELLNKIVQREPSLSTSEIIKKIKEYLNNGGQIELR